MKTLSTLIRPVGSVSKTALEQLNSAIRSAYDRDTCFVDQRSEWSRKHPALGQCVVTTLVVQDYLGGEIISDKKNNHYWNRVDGIDLDFTRDQFGKDVVIKETGTRSRQELLEGPRSEAAETLDRYRKLKGRVEKLLPHNFNNRLTG
jgi:hypothetical protein